MDYTRNAILLILALSLQQIAAKNRVYYIASVDVEWDYAPAGKNAKNGLPLDKDEWVLFTIIIPSIQVIVSSSSLPISQLK